MKKNNIAQAPPSAPVQRENTAITNLENIGGAIKSQLSKASSYVKDKAYQVYSSASNAIAGNSAIAGTTKAIQAAVRPIDASSDNRAYDNRSTYVTNNDNKVINNYYYDKRNADVNN
jgi:hypothetical protein